MNVALEIAMYQWQEGQQRMREADPSDQGRLDTAMYAVLDELRHRLGSTFEIAELADLYAEGTDWAEEIAQGRWAASDAVAVVDAAFARVTGAGFRAAKEPWDAFWGQRYAVVLDPDGNHVNLFAPLESS